VRRADAVAIATSTRFSIQSINLEGSASIIEFAPANPARFQTATLFQTIESALSVTYFGVAPVVFSVHYLWLPLTRIERLLRLSLK
jgi:hypothetical protein